MKSTYLALVYKDAKSGKLWCHFPDVKGAVTEGKDFDELQAMAEDVLLEYIADFQKEKRPLPECTAVDAIMAKADADNGTPLCVLPVTVYPASKTIQIALTGPEDKLAIIKEFAASCGTTRSAFMVEASMEKIARMKRGE